ncbi:MAG: hypothetical protein ACRDJI_01945 [Actinomycetota bacterium]
MMRARLVSLLLPAVLLSAISMPVVHAGPSLAQQDEENSKGGDQKAGTEKGADEGETDSTATEEEGPPWTYQMARISLAILALLALAIGGAYYRFVLMRQRGEA